MGGTFPRVKVWSGNEDVTAVDLNAEFNNIIDNATPQGQDDYSANATQMRVQTSPGAVGTESLATSTAGELERLRFAIARMLGTTYWYETPAVSLADADSLLKQGNSIPKSRIVSGKVRSTSSQPIFLQPSGTVATVTLKASVGVPFKYVINNVTYSLTADVSFTGLSLAPSTNNTALINDGTLAGANDTKYVGEEDADAPTITIDTVGSEITSLLSKFAAFKTGTEAFFGYIPSVTSIAKAFRGYFFDSTDTPVVRTVVSDNAVITLLRLTWVFVKADGTLTVSYTNPTVAFDQPTSPNTGDYWFDIFAGLWKRFDGAAFVDATAVLIGVCAQDTSACKYARSFDPFAFYSDRNTTEIEWIDANTLRSVSPYSEISVYGQRVVFGPDLQEFEMPGDLATGESETASTYYYSYVTESGDTILSAEKPYKRTHDLLGYYHPHQSWRALSKVFEDSGSAMTQASLVSVPETGGKLYSSAGDTSAINIGGASYVTLLSVAVVGNNKPLSVVANATSSGSTAIYPGSPIFVRIRRGSTTIFENTQNFASQGNTTYAAMDSGFTGSATYVWEAKYPAGGGAIFQGTWALSVLRSG